MSYDDQIQGLDSYLREQRKFNRFDGPHDEWINILVNLTFLVRLLISHSSISQHNPS